MTQLHDNQAGDTGLAAREKRAQHGIIEFAEEMQAIRDDYLYPGARQQPDAWKNYCKSRWGLTSGRIDGIIRAMPVLSRRSSQVKDSSTSVEKAIAVASLPIAAQDAILTETAAAVLEADVKAKAQAARQVAKTAAQNGYTEQETVEKMLEAVAAVKPKPKKPKKRKMKGSKFVALLSPAEHYAKAAAAYARTNPLDDVENDFGWAFVERVRLHMDTIAEALYQPEHVKDWDQEAAALLAGDEG